MPLFCVPKQRAEHAKMDLETADVEMIFRRLQQL